MATAPSALRFAPGPFPARRQARRRALRGRHPARRGPHRRRRPAGRPDRAPHRPLAARQVHRRRADDPRPHLVGPGQPADQRGPLRPAARRASSPTSPTATCTPSTPRSAPTPAHRRALRVYTETAWASLFARNLFRRAAARATRPATPTSRSSASRRSRPTRRPRAPAPRRRSCVHLQRMEVIIVGTEYAGEIKKSRLHGHERPAARRGRAADALGDQRRRGGRPGDLLRPVGDGQDDAVGRPAAEPDRRRRARLGRRRRLQLRGRLLRQDHPPLPDVRAGHLPDDAPLRDRARERGPRPADPRARPRLRALHREHARRLSAATSSATSTRPGSPASRATWCS